MVRAKHCELFDIKPDPFDPGDGPTSKLPVKLRLALFVDVKNAAELRQFVLDTPQCEVALVRAELILEPFQILAAAARAISVRSHDKMATKSLHTEILYSLSPSKNISDSLRLFGIGDECTAVLMAAAGEEGGKHITAAAKKIKGGKCVPLKRLREIANYDLAKQAYHVRDPELNKGSVMDAVLQRMVSKDYLS